MKKRKFRVLVEMTLEPDSLCNGKHACHLVYGALERALSNCDRFRHDVTTFECKDAERVEAANRRKAEPKGDQS